MTTPYQLIATTGLIAGETIQFSEVDGEEVGAGVAMSEAGFEIVEPHLRTVASGWSQLHRYGVFELSSTARQELVPSLRLQAAELRKEEVEPQAELLEGLASWLEMRIGDRYAVSVFGI